MIDDDVESEFKRMIEQFMKAFGIPEGSMTIRSWNGSNVYQSPETEIQPVNEEPNVEKIDLGESTLILIDGLHDTDTPTVKVSGSKIIVQISPDRKEIDIEVGFQIDLKKSIVTNRNGVLEISAIKAENIKIKENSGFLKIE
ncbi:MAG: hypothetical protein ACFFDQ_06310 [Candidatus Thorarchaeota archaeon]